MASTVRGAGEYPVRYAVDYVARHSRVSVLFRVILIIPTLVLSSGLSMVAAPVALMLLFRRKYPHWWFEWNREISRFGARVGAYALLLRDEYPSTDEEQSVHLAIDEPDATQLNRWLPLVKWLLAIPHYVVLLFLILGLIVTTVIAWFTIIITGRYPQGLFDYAVGVGRWCNRVGGYAFLLVTDRYPPFSLK